MNKLIKALETLTAIGPVRTARLLGIGYSTYTQYSSDIRPIPLYTERHIEAVMLLPESDLNDLIEKHAEEKKRGRR